MKNGAIITIFSLFIMSSDEYCEQPPEEDHIIDIPDNNIITIDHSPQKELRVKE